MREVSLGGRVCTAWIGTALALVMLATPAQAQSPPGWVCPAPPGGPPGQCAGPAAQPTGAGPNVGAGNPINVISGNKYQREVDLAPLPGVLGLELVRHYNSAHSSATAPNGILGRGWKLSYETELFALGGTVQIAQADGARFIFNRDPKNPGVCGSADPSRGQVLVRRDAHGEHYTWVWNDGRRLSFDAKGKLVQILAPTGEFVSLQYDAEGHLLKVTDPQGRSLRLNYLDARANKGDRFAGVQSMDTPVGRYVYEYGSVLPQGSPHSARTVLANLVKVKLPTHHETDTKAHAYTERSMSSSSVSRIYHYEDAKYPTLLTGISVLGSGSDGKLTNQRLRTWAYDPNARATLSVMGDAKDGIEKVTLQYKAQASPNGKPGYTVLTNSLGQITTYTHQVIGGEYRLLEVRGAGCSTCSEANLRYSYDKHGRLLSTVKLDDDGKPLHGSVSDSDEYGRVTRIGRVDFKNGKPQAPRWLVRYEYEPPSQAEGLLKITSQATLIARPSVIAGKEHTIRIAYNGAGQPTRVTEEGYSPIDDQGQLAQHGTLISRTTTYGYERINNRSVLAQIDGPLTNGAKGDSSDSDITRYRYDARGNHLVGIAYPMSLGVKLEHDEIGRIVTRTARDGVLERLSYDTHGRVVRMERAGYAMTLVYDAAGRVSKVSDVLGQQLAMRHDAAGHLRDLRDQQGNRIVWSYADNGTLNELQLLNPDGSLSQRKRPDPQAQVDIDPVQGVRSLLPDLPRPEGESAPVQAERRIDGIQGQRTLLDARGRETTYRYDDLGRLVAEVSPASGRTVFRYDAADQLVDRIAADGGSTRITRDAGGRVLRVEATGEDGRIEWGRANKPVRIVYREGEERFEYDVNARLIAHTRLIDSKVFVTRYAYDSIGRLTRKTLPDRQMLAYRYNGAMHPRPGVLAGIYREGLVDSPIVTGVNVAGERFNDRGFAHGNGLSHRRILDEYGYPVSVGSHAAAHSELHWVDDANKHGGETKAAYRFPTPVGSRARAEAVLPWRDRAAFHFSQIGAQAPPQPTLMAIVEARAQTGNYDARGRIVEDVRRRYVWDGLNRLIEARSKGLAAQSDALIARYRYNLFGQRIAKVVHGPQGQRITYFFYDGAELTAEADESGASIRQYVYLDGRSVSMLSGRSILAVHTDHRLAPLAVTDKQRVVVWQAHVGDHGAAQIDSSSRIEMPLRGSNQYFDAETGLHYNHHRYLDPSQGRYISPDPMGLAAGPDLYLFALGQPHRYVDPLGLQPIVTDADVAAASFSRRLQHVLERAIPQVPGEIGEALREMVQPAAIATVAAIFGVWAVAQLTPAGWIADAALLGLGYFFLGEAIIDLIRMVTQTYSLTNGATCLADLDRAASNFARLASSAAINAGAGGVTRLASLLRRFFSARRSGVWDMGPGPRGEAIENALGHNVPASYPRIDRWNEATRTGTSIKSINLDDRSYLDPGRLRSRLRTFINELNDFAGANVGGLNTVGRIARKELEIVFPHAGSTGQQAAIREMVQYGRSLGIEVRVIIMP